MSRLRLTPTAECIAITMAGALKATQGIVNAPDDSTVMQAWCCAYGVSPGDAPEVFEEFKTHFLDFLSVAGGAR